MAVHGAAEGTGFRAAVQHEKIPLSTILCLLKQKSLNAQAGRSHFSKIDSDEFGKIGGRPRNDSSLKAG